MKLNKKQQKAATTIDGAVMVLASAGSGKSSVLVTRIANMLASEQMITPNMILALTFTTAGVISIREKLTKTIGVESYKIAIHTFHSFCNEIIQNNPGYFGIRDFEPVTDLERIHIAYEIIDEMPIASPMKRLRGDIYYDSRRLLNLFQLMKDEDFSPEFVSEKIDEYIESLQTRDEFIYKRGNSKKGIKAGDIKVDAINKEKEKMEVLKYASSLLPAYNQKLKEKERYDYSDMIGWVLKAWTDDEYFLLNYQEHYQYVLVDEFQDNNNSQSNLINKLMGYWDNPNIFAVGDDFQNIYEFSGARIANMIEYVKKYNAEVIILNENYRSNQHILDAANNVIQYNHDRLDRLLGIDKSLVAATDKGNSKPEVLVFDNPAQETAYIVSYIESLYESGIDLSEIAILYRKHRQVEDMVNQFERRGVPYKVKRSVNVLDTLIVKQLLTIIDYIVNYNALKPDKYNTALFEILHFNFWGNDYKKIHRYYITLQDEDVQSRKPKDFIRTEEILSSLVKKYHNSTIIQLVTDILNDTGLLEYTLKDKDYLRSTTYLNTFFNWIKTESFKNPSFSGRDILKMIDNMKANGLYLSVVDVLGNSTGVNLLTVHGAKGLEWDHVFIIGANANEWEKSRAGNMNFTLPDTLTLSVKENKLESNRRLFYVAITRAKRALTISYSKTSNDGRRIEPTRFVTETEIIPEEVEYVNMDKYLQYQFSNQEQNFTVEKEVIKQKLDNLVLSPSAVNKYYRCPFTFYIENIVKVPFIAHPALIFGNTMHHLLEKYYNSYRMGLILDFDKLFLIGKTELENHFNEIGKNEFELKVELVHKTLRRVYSDYIPDSNKTTINEYRVNRALIDGVPFKGFFDKMEFIGNLVTISDYKTGSVSGIKDKIKGISEKLPYGNDYFRQGVMYKLLFDEVAKSKEWRFNGFRVDAINAVGIKQFSIEITSDDEAVIRKLIKDTYTNIMTGNFPLCDDPDCKYCNLFRN